MPNVLRPTLLRARREINFSQRAEPECQRLMLRIMPPLYWLRTVRVFIGLPTAKVRFDAIGTRSGLRTDEKRRQRGLNFLHHLRVGDQSEQRGATDNIAGQHRNEEMRQHCEDG
jgi:hypothetical protein